VGGERSHHCAIPAPQVEMVLSYYTIEIMHLSLVSMGVNPWYTPGDLFSGSNKKPLNPWGIGYEIHNNFLLS